MSDSIYLHGSEDVRSAASSMRQSADTMMRAANEISEALLAHTRAMQECVTDLQRLAEEAKR